MYTPKYFKAYELVPKELYEKYKNKEYILFWQFDDKVLMTLDMLREKYGPTTVNNWYYGGNLDERGLRLDGTGTGAGLSPHKRGVGIDCSWSRVTAIQVRQDMDKLGCFEPGFLHKETYTDDEKVFRYIRRIERTLNGKEISWFHFDRFNAENADGSIVQLHV